MSYLLLILLELSLASHLELRRESQGTNPSKRYGFASATLPRIKWRPISIFAVDSKQARHPVQRPIDRLNSTSNRSAHK
jgi:hypothetical protein